MIRLYLKIPEQFVRLFLQDRWWVVDIPFVRMVKLKFIAKCGLPCPSSHVLSHSYHYYYYSLEFSHQRKLMVFHWRVSDSKSPRVSRTLLSILAIFNNAVVWIVSTRPPTSKSSRPINNPLVTVPKAPITIGIIVTFMFHSFFFQFPSKVEVLISLFTFFQFYSVVSRDSKVDNFADILFVVDYYKVWSSGRD